MYFPQSRKIDSHLVKLISIFVEKQDIIDSEKHQGKENLESDVVLSIVADGLQSIGYKVEKSKKRDDKIRVPVLYGLNGQVDLAFEVDGYCEETQTVIEVEAGRAVVNYQFLKDFYEACMMQDIHYFCVAVKNRYGTSKDFEKVCRFFKALYASNRMQVPLNGVLIIGY